MASISNHRQIDLHPDAGYTGIFAYCSMNLAMAR